MDEVARYNLARWDALARSDALYTRPRLDAARPTGALVWARSQHYGAF